MSKAFLSILFLVTGFVTPAISQESKQLLEFNCGRKFNVVQYLTIKRVRGQHYPYSAILTLADRDATTGILTGVDYKLAGGTESSDEIDGRMQSVFALINEVDPTHQFYIQNVNTVGTKAKAINVKIIRGSNGQPAAKTQRLTCLLEKAR